MIRPARHPTPRRPATRPLAAWCVWLCAAAALAEPNAAPPVPWSRQELEIPYRWTGPTEGVASVVLYYSDDRGRSWKQAGVGLPHVRSFRFQAPADGEYWFAIRTYDTLGRAAPSGPLGPEMRVLVDTSGPQITRLDARLDGDTLRVDLDAEDAAGVEADAVRLYAQAEGRPGWLPIPVTAADPSADGRSLRLEAAWVAPPGVASVAVRAAVEDTAGNRAEESTTATSTAQPKVDLFAAAPTPGRTASFGGGAVDPFAAAERRAAQAAPPARREPPKPPATTPWPAESTAAKPLRADEHRDADSSPSPFNSASFRGPAPEGFDPAPFTPGDTTRRFVNDTEFEFEYELEQSGRWGVGKVELWGTDNGGRSWKRFAVDSDRQSPIHVATPGEGEYGFRLVVESVGGLEAPTPRPGDRPEAVVVVDLREPRAVLRGARQGEGYFADQLIIEWRVDDQRLADRPIDLFYSNRPTGPWVPIATNLANSGRHTWRLQRHLPRRPLIKLEARDAAGNVATAITPEPVEIDVPTASGSLRGVRTPP